MDNSQLIADLRGTREHLATAGWCKGNLRDDVGAFCIDGAILMATHGMHQVERGGYDRLNDEEDRAGKVAGALRKHLPSDWVESYLKKFNQTYYDSELDIDVSEILYDYNDHRGSRQWGAANIPATTIRDMYLLIDKALADVGGLG